MDYLLEGRRVPTIDYTDILYCLTGSFFFFFDFDYCCIVVYLLLLVFRMRGPPLPLHTPLDQILQPDLTYE